MMTVDEILREVQGISEVEAECRGSWADAAIKFWLDAIGRFTW